MPGAWGSGRAMTSSSTSFGNSFSLKQHTVNEFVSEPSMRSRLSAYFASMTRFVIKGSEEVFPLKHNASGIDAHKKSLASSPATSFQLLVTWDL